MFGTIDCSSDCDDETGACDCDGYVGYGGSKCDVALTGYILTPNMIASGMVVFHFSLDSFIIT